MKYDLDLLKYIWDNRNPASYVPCFFNITIEAGKDDWHYYGIWINRNAELMNISETVYNVIFSRELGEIKLWQDTQYWCRPSKVKARGFISYLLFAFFEGIAQILLENSLISETEASEAQRSYLFGSANYFKRLL